MDKTGDKLTKTSQQSDLRNYNLDHVYCSDNSRYRSTGTHLNLAAAASDLKSLRKENKQLQAMLLLHLDLIQEQSNQLIAKDKQLLQLKEENQQLRQKCERNATSERRQNNNRLSGGKLLNTSGGGSNSPTIDSYFIANDSKVTARPHDANKTKSPNILTHQNTVVHSSAPANENQSMNEMRSVQSTLPVKIEVNSDEAKSTAADKHRAVTTTSHTNIAHDKVIPVKYRAVEKSVVGNNNGKLISKIILQRKKLENGEKIFVRTKNIDIANKVNYEKWTPLRTIKSEVVESEVERAPVVQKTPSPKSNTINAATDEDVSSDTLETSFVTASVGNSSPPTADTQLDSDLSTNFQSHPIKMEVNADDLPENPMRSPACNTLDDSMDMSNVESPPTSESMPTVTRPPSPIILTVSKSSLNRSKRVSRTKNITSTTRTGPTILYPTAKRHIARNAILTTKKEYKTREWQLEEIENELKHEITDEVCKEDNEACLELPKWRTWEMSSNREAPVPREYEDLHDEVFTRRHARFLLDERKRKKWDVQRIREQRTIERLKRRHCKDEINQQINFNEITTFFPTVDQLKSISITDDLPVSAFGESIPLLPVSEFTLPWHLPPNAGPPGQINAKNEHLSAPDFHSRSNSNCSSASLEPTPANVSSIVLLTKKRAGRTRSSISHHTPHPHRKSTT